MQYAHLHAFKCDFWLSRSELRHNAAPPSSVCLHNSGCIVVLKNWLTLQDDMDGNHY